MSIVRKWIAALFVLACCPAIAFAQGTIAGTVKDSSGAVLPGVTVEAASPVLIEKSRSVTTDGSGQYKVIDLRPGTYTVTFTLTGFNTVVRDGVMLTGSFTATVNADLKVGAVEESITVTGETPIVDVQSSTKQRVLNKDVVDALPTGRLLANLGVLVPGVSVTSNGGTMAGGFQDVGGASGDQMPNLVAHGSRADNARITSNGMNINAISGYMGGRTPNPGAMQEVTVDSGGASAEAGQGGPRMNMIPREGGNTFKGSVFGSFTNDKMQGNNLTTDLQNRGLPVPNSTSKIWDFNPGFGGPLVKDKLWFYMTARTNGSYNFVGAGVFANKNVNNPNAWTYDPDLSQPTISTAKWADGQTRLTWQATPRNKFAFMGQVQTRSGARWINGSIVAPEANNAFSFPQERAFSGEWSAPVTNKLLIEAGLFQAIEEFNGNPSPLLTNPSQMISVTEQSTGRTYRNSATYSNSLNDVFYPRVAVSYVTGAHAFKFGYNDELGYSRGFSYDLEPPVSYRFNNGVPNQITEYATPYATASDLDHDMGLFGQDKWTVGRATVTAGLRYDWAKNHFPQITINPGPLVPNRSFTSPETPYQDYKDITPHLGLAYDLFGTGKTAVRVSLNKYLVGAIGSTGGSPAGSIVTNTTRSWTDSNGNFIPDCDLLNTAKNGECGGLANTNFGTLVAGTTYDPNYLTGWNHRNYNWEFSTGVQQQIAQRVALDVAFFRRWYGNFAVTDNLAVSASDYQQFSITAPTNPLLPGGGGQTINGLFDLNPSAFGRPGNNYVTLDSAYGNQYEHYNGVDVSLNARLQNGLLLQGGFSSGVRELNDCEIVAKVPEMLFGVQSLNYAGLSGSWLPAQYCDQKTGIETQVKGLASYTVPKIDVQVSGTFQSIPGTLLFSNFNAPNSLAQSSLGRSLSGGASNITVELVNPGTAYGDRINQLDLRFGKILKYGHTRTSLNVDVYNALNTNSVLVESQTYATYRTPQQIMLARFAKIGVNFDF